MVEPRSAAPTDAAPSTQQVRLPALPAVVDARVHHRRHTPLVHAFTATSRQWLVDLDDLPRRGRAARWSGFLAADHFDRGRLGGGIRGDLVRFLTHRGVPPQLGDRLLMWASPRQFAHTFNPLSVHWCLSPDGQVRAAVLEVHNTYRERHAYLLHPDAVGSAEVDKAFYVSPFNDVSGRYVVRLRLSPDLVSVAVSLDREGARVFDASAAGRPVPVTRATLARMALTQPFVNLRVSAGIRRQGIRLWAKRLPVVTRHPHSQEAVR